MPDIKHPKCQHPKCGAKMQRIYKRDRAAFIPCGWMCMDCGMMLKDRLTDSIQCRIEGVLRQNIIELKKGDFVEIFAK